MSLSVVIPVKYPSAHLSNISKIVEVCRQLEVQTVVVFDTSLVFADYEPDFNKLRSLNAEIIAGDFGSPGQARNIGLEKTYGKWVAFWDADDEPNVQEYVRAISNFGSDYSMIIGGFKIMTNQGVISYIPAVNYESKSLVAHPGIWRFLFRRELIGEIRFPHLKLGEDQVFLARIFSKHPAFRLVNNPFYIYKLGVEGQLTSRLRRDRSAQQFIAARQISEMKLPLERDCFFCDNSLGFGWKLSLGCIRNLGLLGSVQGLGYARARFFLLGNILRVGLKGNLKYFSSLRRS